MDRQVKQHEVRVERKINASPEDAYDAWLNPEFPGTPWNAASKLVFDARIDGLFYSRLKETAHYGRFTVLEPGQKLQHTWVSPYTEGQESVVTVTFAQSEHGTRMMLVHSGLPDNDKGYAHDGGWTYFLDMFPKQFEAATQA